MAECKCNSKVTLIRGELGLVERKPRKDDPLRDHFVWWDAIDYAQVQLLANTLESAHDERPLQRIFETHPLFLIQHLVGGHGRWCIPQKRLGAEYVPDFVIGTSHSEGHEWYAVELESPKARLFTKNGDPSRTLNHALRQIRDWRAWLTNNIDYARRSPVNNGLGLTDIDGEVKATILIGRRSTTEAYDRTRRRQLCKDHKVEIHTYDWLIEECVRRCEALNCRPI